MTLAGQRSSIWYSSVIGKRYYHLAHDLLHAYLHYIECLLTYLLAYLIAGLSTCNEDSIPNCGAQVLCKAYIQQLQG